MPSAIFDFTQQSHTPLERLVFVQVHSCNSGDTFKIVVNGKQTHAALPWLLQSVSPYCVVIQVIQGIQTIESRQVNVLLNLHDYHWHDQWGNRPNIIPDTVEMSG